MERKQMLIDLNNCDTETLTMVYGFMINLKFYRYLMGEEKTKEIVSASITPTMIKDTYLKGFNAGTNINNTVRQYMQADKEIVKKAINSMVGESKCKYGEILKEIFDEWLNYYYILQ